MNKGFIKVSLLLAGALALAGIVGYLVTATNAEAKPTPPEPKKVEICHCATPNHCKTENVAESALSGHFDAQGNPLHQGDHLGKCTKDVCDNIEDVQETVPDKYYEDKGACYPQTPVCTDRKALNYDSKVDKKEYSDNSVCTYKQAEYKIVDIVKQCNGTTDVTVTTNSHRDWRINDGEAFEIGVTGGGVEGNHTWENVPEGWILYWSNVGKGDWKEADLKSESYTVNEKSENCTPDPTPTPEQPKGTTPAGAPQCTDHTPLVLPSNVHVVRSGADATVNFFTQSSNANIYFKEVSAPNWEHAARDIVVTGGYVSYTIHDLNPALGYTFGVQAANSCAGGETVVAVVVDGPESVTFPMNYWEWLK